MPSLHKGRILALTAALALPSVALAEPPSGGSTHARSGSADAAGRHDQAAGAKSDHKKKKLKEGDKAPSSGEHAKNSPN